MVILSNSGGFRLPSEDTSNHGKRASSRLSLNSLTDLVVYEVLRISEKSLLVVGGPTTFYIPALLRVVWLLRIYELNISFALPQTIDDKAARVLLSFGSAGSFVRCGFERGYQVQTQAPNHQAGALSAWQDPSHLPRET